jgi:hypothetical protein
MSGSPIIVTSGPSREKPATVRRASDTEWSLLAGIGLVFLILGLVDLVLAWYPTVLGSPDWEFATITATFNGLIVPSMGLMFLVSAGVARRTRLLVRVAAVILILLAVTVVGLAALYATNLPLAFKNIQNEVVRAGLIKAVIKTLIQAALYPLLFIWVAVKGLRAVRES